MRFCRHIVGGFLGVTENLRKGFLVDRKEFLSGVFGRFLLGFLVDHIRDFWYKGFCPYSMVVSRQLLNNIE